MRVHRQSCQCGCKQNSAHGCKQSAKCTCISAFLQDCLASRVEVTVRVTVSLREVPLATRVMLASLTGLSVRPLVQYDSRLGDGFWLTASSPGGVFSDLLTAGGTSITSVAWLNDEIDTAAVLCSAFDQRQIMMGLGLCKLLLQNFQWAYPVRECSSTGK